MKKEIIVIFTLVIIGTLVVIVFTQFFLNNPPVGRENLPEGAPPLSQNEIDITGVETRNFYRKAVHVNELKNVVFEQRDEYSIRYRQDSNTFLISITAGPVQEVRLQAEADFLTTLGIEEQESCKLEVEVFVAHWVAPELAGQNLGLSFCQ